MPAVTDQPAIIPTHTERQALDWSLVLASQGIEASIERHPEGGGCLLVVSGAEQGRAVQAIRQYVAENRARRWQRELPWNGLIYDWRNVAWFVLLIALFLLVDLRAPGLREAGIMDDLAVRRGEWWRLFTATMLHADVGHLAANVATGLILVGLAMGSFGPGVGLLTAYLAGAGGNVAGLLLYPQAHRSLGASGMVMGALGLLTAQALARWSKGMDARQLAMRGGAAGMLLLVLLGLNPEARTDVIGHVGGFATGLLLGLGLSWLPARWVQSPWIQRTATLSCLALTLFTWRLALR